MVALNLLGAGSTLHAQSLPFTCCSRIFETGNFLGWGASFLEATQIRQKPSPYDNAAYDLLNGASRLVGLAYQSCKPAIPAWSNWQYKQNWLETQIRELQSSYNHNTKRRHVFQRISGTYNSWANDLSIAAVNGQYIKTTTCATCYFRFGYTLAYAVQALRHANEALNRNNDLESAKREMNLVRQHYRMFIADVYKYIEARQPKGSFLPRCVNLKDQTMIDYANSMINECNSLNNIPNKIDRADKLNDAMRDALRRGCPEGGSNPNPTPHPNPSPAPQPPPNIEYGINRPGSDYKNFNVSNDPAMCRNRCEAEDRCKAWTFVKPEYQGTSARCWLKFSVPSAKNDPRCVSGVKNNTQIQPAFPLNQSLWEGTWRVTSKWECHPGHGATWTFTVSISNNSCRMTRKNMTNECQIIGNTLKWKEINSRDNLTFTFNRQGNSLTGRFEGTRKGYKGNICGSYTGKRIN